LNFLPEPQAQGLRRTLSQVAGSFNERETFLAAAEKIPGREFPNVDLKRPVALFELLA